MINALENLKSEYQFSVEIIDIDANETLLQKYDELVPVLFWRESSEVNVQICHYFLDENKVREYLGSIKESIKSH